MEKSEKEYRQRTELDDEPEIPAIQDWAAKLAKMKPKPNLIKDILPAQKGEYIAVAGRTGIGKTNLCLHLALCLATGTPFFGLKCEKVYVALFIFEGGPSDLLKRYEKVKHNFPSHGRRLRFESLPISNPQEMRDTIFETAKGCKVIILDPVKFIVSGDYLKPKDADKFIKIFKQRLIKHNMSAILTLPIKKPNEKSLIQPSDVYQMKGATEYADAATSVILVEKKSHRRSSDEVTLHFAKTRIASQELGKLDLHFNRDRCIFELMKDQEEEFEDDDDEMDMNFNFIKNIKKS